MNNIIRPILLFFLIGILMSGSCQDGHQKKKPDKNSKQDTMEAKYTNHLINETSPYLLQHAHNPVNWYPWGEEALQKAKDEDKLILISVGYSACHWCHVMEHESFEDEEVARIMNEHFICIKVDREERPDIDQIYMDAVQLMTQRGGWPLNCFALPDGRPFYGGTYFPKNQWVNVLNSLTEEYKNNRSKVEEYATLLTEGIAKNEVIELATGEAAFRADTLQEMVTKWRQGFDHTWGGMNRAPKFPLPNNYLFLLRYAKLAGDDQLSDFVQLTLKKMAFGGIYDQIGGGFARYSTDKEWKVPHFEKMLYDNGQLVSLYAEAYTRYKNPLYKEVVYQTLAFAERELYAGNGVFYSSLDADSEGEEGTFYVWKRNEFEQVTGDNAKLMMDYYNIDMKALWENGKNVLMRYKSDEDLAKKHKMRVDEFRKTVKRENEKLFEYRAKRERPGLDDKSLTSWNALMMKGYLDAYFAFNEPHFLEMALKTADFITKQQRRSDGGLNHNFKNGVSNINGYLEDYSFAVEALIALYSATFDERWLQEATALADYAIAHFRNEDSGMFYFTSNLDEALIARKSEITDNVIPASNSGMARSLFLLGEMMDNTTYRSMAATMLNNMQPHISNYGPGYSNWAILQLNMVYPFYEVAIVGQRAPEKRGEFMQYFVPNKVVLGSKKASSLPLLEGKYVKDQTLIYVCVEKACQLPVTDVEEALKQVR